MPELRFLAGSRGEELRTCYYYYYMLLVMLCHTTLPLVLTGASWYLGSSWYYYATLFLCCKMLVFDRIGFSPSPLAFLQYNPSDTPSLIPMHTSIVLM